MFRTLPAAEFTEDDLKKLAGKMVAPAEAGETSENKDDDEENQGSAPATLIWASSSITI